MSGGGRKHRAKHLTAECFSEVEILPGEEIVQVVQCRAGTIYEAQRADGTFLLCKLPRKFEKVVWVKRGDYLVLDALLSEAPSEDKIKATVKGRLFEDQIKALKRNGNWPNFTMQEAQPPQKETHTEGGEKSDDSDAELPQNPNRKKFSDSEPSSDDGDD